MTGQTPSNSAIIGAAAPRDLYVAVGEALTWWESSEDIILGLFRQICDEIEPMAVGRFTNALRKNRYQMLKMAMQTYSFRFVDNEIDIVTSALKELGKLADVRDQIAHGNVAVESRMEEGAVAVSGHFLLPSFNEGEFHERTFRYRHTPETISNFVSELRNWRGQIMDVHGALMNRTQSQIHGVPDGFALLQVVRRFARLETFGQKALDELTKYLMRAPSSR